MKRVHDSLERVFQGNRIVFWYDPEGEWVEAFDSFAYGAVVKLTVSGNEFGTKVRIIRDPDPEARFLVYVPAARPADADNWLLDLLLQGHEFKADRASLAAQEVGLAHEYVFLAQDHPAYFRSEKRLQALKERIGKDDQPRDIRLKMMAILAGTEVEVDALLLCFLADNPAEDSKDPVTGALGAAALDKPFWGEVERAFGYSSVSPSVSDFALWLFRAANPLDGQVRLHPHAKVFVQRWKDSQRHCEAYRHWADKMERALQVALALEKVEDSTALGDCDTFEVFDKFVIHGLGKAFARGGDSLKIRETIALRKGSFWRDRHADGYSAVEHAVDLREALAAAELTIGSIDEGARRYVATWWRIDQAYRRCTYHMRRYGQVQVLEPVASWVKKAYVNNFLLPVADRWSDQVGKLDRWDCSAFPAQFRFFDKYVSPYFRRGKKVFVIVSDALRYEAAVEFAQRLQAFPRWTAEVEAMFGSLPTYTQLGMASLLPGKQRAIDAATGNVTVDGQSATGTDNRADILAAACGGKATSIQARDFLDLNTKTDGAALMRDHDVVYIFHNHIDKVGDNAGTEERTFDAVEETFAELEKIIKKAANINASNMLLTSDHGFLFQQDEVDEADMKSPPAATEITYQDRRFALGKGIGPNPDVKVFSAQDLGLGGDWSAAFPRSIARFRRKGGGKRYVHGGFTLQEVIVPVVKIHKARSDDTQTVEVEILKVPSTITTGQVAIALFQDRPAGEKVLGRTLRIGVFASDGTTLSELKTIAFDSREAEPRKRETPVLLTLSHAADSYNTQEVEIRLEYIPAGTSQFVTYKRIQLKLQKPFASDFDDF